MNKGIKKIINNIKSYENEYCVDDEFYINLTNKEKNIIKVKNILTGDDEDETNS